MSSRYDWLSVRSIVDVEALIFVFENERVCAVSLQRMPVQAIAALLDFVFDGVEERLVIGCPGNRVTRSAVSGKSCMVRRSRICSRYWRNPTLSVV